MGDRDNKKAPKGRFVVFGHDDRSDPGWRKDDFSSLALAKKAATNGGTVLFRVYDDTGECVYSGK